MGLIDLVELLGEGEINTDWSEFAIDCPLHGTVFDVRTGEVLNPPAQTPVRTYPVEVEAGMVKVRRTELDVTRRS